MESVFVNLRVYLSYGGSNSNIIVKLQIDFIWLTTFFTYHLSNLFRSICLERFFGLIIAPTEKYF